MILAADVATIIGTVATVVGLVAAGGGALAFLRVNMARGTLELYRQDNDALRGRVDTLEEELVVERAKGTESAGRLVALERERDVLRDLATGHSAVDALGEIVLRNHRELLERLDSLDRGSS